MNDAVKVLDGYIRLIRKQFNVNVVLNDAAGISDLDPAIGHVLTPYTYHNNPFCNHVKKDRKCFEQCIKNSFKVYAYCREKRTPFYGSCYLGLEEYIYPVQVQGKIIAVICIGQFSEVPEKSLEIIREKAVEFGLDADELEKHFRNTVRPVAFDASELDSAVGMLGEYLSLFFRSTVSEKGRPDRRGEGLALPACEHTDNHIVNHTVQFIKGNFSMDLSLRLLASHSFCNPAYLSHVFKEKMNINVTDYIHQVRIDTAKELLDITSKSVTEISAAVGFNDSNYFSRVFKRLTGMGPRQYRDGQAEK